MVGSKKFEALVVCGPSGSGKSTLLKKLFEDFPCSFGFSVSHTTRNPRPGEEEGVHYFFTNKDSFKDEITKGNFLEHAIYSENFYGTSKKAVDAVVKSGKICVLDIDIQGVKQVKQTDLKALYVFIKPPSIGELEKRLVSRKTETDESLKKRLDVAIKEIEFGETPGNFDKIIVNDDVDKAYSSFREFVMGEVEEAKDSNGYKK